VRSADTDPEAHDRQLRVYRSMTPGQRVALAVEMSEEAFTLAADGIRARHPDYGDDEVDAARRRLRVGDKDFRAAWPDQPLVAP
jgi:hypothetical protein